MAYTFLQIRTKGKTDSNGTWYLLGDSTETIKEHFNVYGKDYFKQGVKAYFDYLLGGKLKHYDHTWPQLVEIESQRPENIGLPWFIVATKLENKMLQQRLDPNFSSCNPYLGKNMTILMNNPTIEIVETKVSEKMIYPDDEKLSLSDVRYIQWYHGKHWYAKIGKLDVVDQYGNQKWDTKEEAMQASQWFVEDLIANQ